MVLLVEIFRKHIRSKGSPTTELPVTFLQDWWVVEKCVEGPDSGNTFCHVVGVLRKEEKNLKKPYRQTRVLVLMRGPLSREGIPLNWGPQISFGPVGLNLFKIDYEYKIFDDWD